MFSSALDAAKAFAAPAFEYYGQRAANQANIRMAREANAFSAAQAQKSMDFSERMSSTSWQRGVADMKAAGINPMLAFSQGGASAPQGTSATGTTGAPQRSETSGAVSSAISALRLKADLKNLLETNNQIRSQTNLNKANTELSKEQKRKVTGEANVSNAEGSAIGIGLRFLDRFLSSGSSAKSLFGSIIKRAPKGTKYLPTGPSRPY